MRSMRLHRFTLLELLAVIGIIALLAAIMIGGVSAGMRKASEAKTRSRMHQLEVAFEQYRRDWGYYPVSAGTPCSQIAAPCTDPAIAVVRWDHTHFCSPAGNVYVEGYPTDTDGIDNNAFNDGFGNPFYYRCPGYMNTQSYDLWSAGADGLFGGPAPAPNTDPANAFIATENDDITNWKRQ